MRIHASRLHPRVTVGRVGNLLWVLVQALGYVCVLDLFLIGHVNLLDGIVSHRSCVHQLADTISPAIVERPCQSVSQEKKRLATKSTTAVKPTKMARGTRAASGPLPRTMTSSMPSLRWRSGKA